MEPCGAHALAWLSAVVITTNSVTSVVILISSTLSQCILHCIQWEKVEVIHREENRITRDVRELVGSDESKRTHHSSSPYRAPAVTRERQLKYGSKRNDS
jgi:hypothetical protein